MAEGAVHDILEQAQQVERDVVDAASSEFDRLRALVRTDSHAATAAHQTALERGRLEEGNEDYWWHCAETIAGAAAMEGVQLAPEDAAGAPPSG
jgi:hypothetical protein